MINHSTADVISGFYRTLNHHLDKFCARAAECGRERRSHILCLRDTDCLEPKSLCNASKINRRVDKVHADEMVTMVERQESLFDDPVATVVHNHNRQWQLMMCCRPQCLDRVHRTAVARIANHRPIGICEAYTDRCRQSPADAARSKSVIAITVTIGMQRRHMARSCQSFVDEDGLWRHPLDNLQRQPVGINRRAIPIL